jgi:hypothetical protein
MGYYFEKRRQPAVVARGGCQRSGLCRRFCFAKMRSNNKNEYIKLRRQKGYIFSNAK